jgi:secreted trypsin-like serine protease
VALVAGWGKNTTSDDLDHESALPAVQQKALVTIQARETCNQQLGNGPSKSSDSERNNLHICTVDVNGTHIYSGDSGGPISLPDGNGKQTQVGISSNVVAGEVSFFANVQELLPWIDYYSDLYGAQYCKT